MTEPLTIALPSDLIDQVADRVLARLAGRETTTPAAWLDVHDYLRPLVDRRGQVAGIAADPGAALDHERAYQRVDALRVIDGRVRDAIVRLAAFPVRSSSEAE